MRAFAAAFTGIASAAVAPIRAAAARATIALANLDMGHLFWFAACYRTFQTAWVSPPLTLLTSFAASSRYRHRPPSTPSAVEERAVQKRRERQDRPAGGEKGAWGEMVHTPAAD